MTSVLSTTAVWSTTVVMSTTLASALSFQGGLSLINVLCFPPSAATAGAIIANAVDVLRPKDACPARVRPFLLVLTEGRITFTNFFVHVGVVGLFDARAAARALLVASCPPAVDAPSVRRNVVLMADKKVGATILILVLTCCWRKSTKSEERGWLCVVFGFPPEL